MKKMLLRAVLIFLVFFLGTATVLTLDQICLETTGSGGKLVLDIDNFGLFQ